MQASLGVCRAYNWKRRFGSVSFSVSYTRLAADNTSRPAERPSAGTADSAIAKRRGFRIAIGCRSPVKAQDGGTYSGVAGPNPSRPEDRQLGRQTDQAHVWDRSKF